MDNELQELIGDQFLEPDEYIPAELLLNDNHPDADQYAEDRRDVERKVFAFGKQLKPKHREFVRYFRSGMPVKDIAKKLACSKAAIYRYASRPDVQRYIALLDYQQRLIDGADLAHRKGVLWRVALDNEEKRPNITIQALQEINKMSGTYVDAGNKGNGNVVNSQINGEMLPRGPLDTMPETFETQQLPDGSFKPTDV